MLTLAVKAVIEKISTMKDGGFRVSLDIAETDLAVVQSLMKLKTESALIAVVFQELEEES